MSLLSKNNYQLMLYYNIKSYVKKYNIYLLSKIVRYELYSNLYFFLITTHL